MILFLFILNCCESRLSPKYYNFIVHPDGTYTSKYLGKKEPDITKLIANGEEQYIVRKISKKALITLYLKNMLKDKFIELPNGYNDYTFPNFLMEKVILIEKLVNTKI